MSGLSLDFIFRTCTGHGIDHWTSNGELDWYNAYADKQQDAGKGILVADWNNFPHGGREWIKGEGYPDTITVNGKVCANGTTSKAMHQFERILESAGYKLEWRDQTSRCDHCSGCICTEPDYMDNYAHFALLSECELVCETCIVESFQAEYLELMEWTSKNGQKQEVNIPGIDPSEHGYVLVEEGLEYSDFGKVYRRLRESGLTAPILFRHASSSMFGNEVWRKVVILSMTRGTLPDKDVWDEHWDALNSKGELRGGKYHITLGRTDSHDLEEFRLGDGAWDCDSLYECCKEIIDASQVAPGDEGIDGAMDFVSSIMETLMFEWI